MKDTTNATVDIHKASGILINDRRLLVERSKDAWGIFLAPGGRIEKDETAKQALVRELAEEIQVTVDESDLENFGTYFAKAAGQEHLTIRMDVFLVAKWQGDPSPDSEVDEIRWIGSKIEPGLKIGSIFEPN